MKEAFSSRPGEIVPGSQNPPLKPDIAKDIRAFDTADRFAESAEREKEALRAAMDALNKKPSDAKSNPGSGVRLSRKPNPLPESPFTNLPSGTHIEHDEDRAA